MAQVELRLFNPDMSFEKKQRLCEFVQTSVFRVHYPEELPDRRTGSGIVLKPGDITLVVPRLETGLSVSDADFELEISEGSDNWPKDESGSYLLGNAMQEALEQRASRISKAIQGAHGAYSHNIFEVNGQGTGWVQYKPSGTV